MVQMLALNTPQFDWCRTRLPDHPQPVPPIYNPEIGARAVYWAAHNRRREIYVGITGVATIFGQSVIPGLLDVYLGRTGYQAQQTNEAVEADRPDNLFKPVSGEFAAHGSFDQRAARRSPELWLATHGRLAAATLLAGGLGFGLLRWFGRLA